MRLKEIEKYWLDLSEEDFDTALTLFNNNKYVPSMFFLHLSVEKLLKAAYVHQNSEEAPYGHNLTLLTSKIINISFSEEWLGLLEEISTFNIAARYDDYKRNFYEVCNKEFASRYISKLKEFKKWLTSQLT